MSGKRSRKSGATGADDVARRRAVTDPSVAESTVARRYRIYVIVAMVGFAVVLSVLSIQRYRGFYGGRFDMGNMVQAVYNTAHGRFLEATTADGVQASRLGSHVDPILAVFAVPWLVWPSPIMLLVVQAIVVALAAWPAYRLARRLLGDDRAAFFLSAALLLYPPLQYAVLNEFHPVTLAIPFLLFGFLHLEEDRPWRAAPFLVLAALCKEDIPLVIAVMGAYFALRKRSWKPLIVTAAATAYFAVAFAVILPHFNPGGSPFVDRYADYGSGAGEVARNVFLRPGTTLADLFAWSNVRYLLQMLWPFLFTSLASPLTTLIALPELLLNALADRGFQRSIEFHYVAGEVPFVFAGAVLGVARVRRFWARRGAEAPRRAQKRGRAQKRSAARKAGTSASRLEAPAVGSIAAAVLCASLAANFVMGPLPFSLPGAAKTGRDYRVSAHAQALAEAVRMIPANGDAVVSTENDAGSHLSARRTIYVFPKWEQADWVLVDEKAPYMYDREDPSGHAKAFADFVAKEMLSGGYLSVFAKDGVYVFKRAGAEVPAAPGGALVPGGSPIPGGTATPGAGIGSPAPGNPGLSP